MSENKEPTSVSGIEADDAWLDEALRETFPASDPIPLRHRESSDDPWAQRNNPPVTPD